MKFSEQWLREWVNPTMTREALSEELSMVGLEVDHIAPVAGVFKQVLVGHVKSVEPHPDADRLRVCQVDVGARELLNIVCGGANVRVDLNVAVAVVGAELNQEFKIRETKLRGVLSQGMICSSSELGLAETSEGIMELPTDAPVGKDVRDYLQLADYTLSIDLTPNRGDCLSIAGIAREVAAITDTQTTPIKIKKIAANSKAIFPVQVKASEDCPRYVGRVLEGIDANAPSPMWLQERLRRSDIRSINVVVDVTNYVMLELGQPMHAFDLERLQGAIIVRRAQAKETLTLLDEKAITLTPEDLVICDEKGPLALAGVMGGKDSGIDERCTTTKIFLESAFFDPVRVGVRARAHGLQTDSSYRFERGVDPQLQVDAIERATALLLEIAGGQAGPVIEVANKKALPAPLEIVLRPERIKRVLGFVVDDEKIESVLTHLGMHLKSHKVGWKVTVPNYRFDIQLEIDLIEEVVRVYGYARLPEHEPNARLDASDIPETVLSLRRIKQVLVDSGYQEAVTYSFVDQKIQGLLTPDEEPLTLVNPITSELTVMRNTLWPGLLKTLLHNRARQQERLRLFEAGLCFRGQGDALQQERVLAGLVTGNAYPEQWGMCDEAVDFFHVKGDLERLFAMTGHSHEYEWRKCEHSALHPGRSAEIWGNDEQIGYLGAIHPRITQKLKINQEIFLFQLSLSILEKVGVPEFKELSKFPAIRRDIAIVVDKSITAAKIRQKVLEISGNLVKNVQLFDVYSGAGIAEEQRSLALGLTLQHPDKTLVDDEVNTVIERIVSSLKQEFNATLRN